MANKARAFTAPAVVILVGMLVAALSSPAHAQPATSQKKVIVFLEGVCTRVGGPQATDTFKDLKEVLRGPEFGYGAGDFLAYSYNGGAVDATTGDWTPQPYGLLDPIRTSVPREGLAALHDELLVPYRAKHPNTSFVLVGHSLGSMVAIAELLGKVSSTNYERGFISTIVTIDGPLHGIPARNKSALEAVMRLAEPELQCVVDGQAADQLVRLHNQPGTGAILRRAVALAKQREVTVVNVGNKFDCVWVPAHCSQGDSSVSKLLQRLLLFADNDALTQWIFGTNNTPSDAKLAVLDIPKPCLEARVDCFRGTHGAALNKSIGPEGPAALRTIATYIGPQNAISQPALTFSSQPSGGQAGAAFSVQPVVTVKDANNNTVTAFTGPITLSLKTGTGTPGATLNGTATTNAINGVATFSGLSIDKAGTGYVLTASAPGVTAIPSTPFAVTSAAQSNTWTALPTTGAPSARTFEF
ncbi:MAG: hypothetical protein ACKVVP_07290, partial [Chloroflexota bacterium]